MTGQDYIDLIQALTPLMVGVILPAIHRIVKNIVQEDRQRLKRIEDRQLKQGRKIERIERATVRPKELD